MRQIGSLTSEQDAQTFADYLLTRGITSKLDVSDGAVKIWIRDEDQLELARDEFSKFEADPAAAPFREAAASAKHLRQEAQRREEQYRRSMIDMRRRWSPPGGASERPLTVALMVLSVAVTLLSNFGAYNNVVCQKLSITRIYSNAQGQIAVERNLNAIRHGQVWRLFTPVLLHGGILHLVFNMIWLYDLGGMIESRRGTRFLAVFVLATGIFSNLAQYIWAGPLFLGMSGVVYALFGYIWMQSKFNPRSGLYVHPNTVFWLVLWFFICVVGLMPQVANMAHGAGLAAGIVVGYAPVMWRKLKGN